MTMPLAIETGPVPLCVRVGVAAPFEIKLSELPVIESAATFVLLRVIPLSWKPSPRSSVEVNCVVSPKKSRFPGSDTGAETGTASETGQPVLSIAITPVLRQAIPEIAGRRRGGIEGGCHKDAGAGEERGAP